jgi:hypothetical protein
MVVTADTQKTDEDMGKIKMRMDGWMDGWEGIDPA